METRVRAFFGPDEHPEASWEYLHELDQAWVERIALAGGDDPGVLPTQELRKLGADEQRRRLLRVEDWHKAWPFVHTTQVREIERYFATVPEPRPHLDNELLDTPLITGQPGTGKTCLLKREAAKALCRAAWGRRLEREGQPPRNLPLVDPYWRPVVFHSADGNPRVKTFFTHLCNEIAVPAGTDPQAAFQTAVLRHGIQYVFIDEVQMINFDGQHGMYLHNALKAIQNMNVRVVLSGHNVRNVLAPRQTAAQNAAQSQSIARWTFLELQRYPHETEADVVEWRKLLRVLEKHVRLAGHEPGETVFSTAFQEQLWVSTLGYMNALATLITQATLLAARTTPQAITARIIDRIPLNGRVEKARTQRLKAWRAGLFNWATDAAINQ